MFQSADKKIQEQLNLWISMQLKYYMKKLDSLENEYVDFYFKLENLKNFITFLRFFKKHLLGGKWQE